MNEMIVKPNSGPNCPKINLKCNSQQLKIGDNSLVCVSIYVHEISKEIHSCLMIFLPANSKTFHSEYCSYCYYFQSQSILYHLFDFYFVVGYFGCLIYTIKSNNTFQLHIISDGNVASQGLIIPCSI